MKIYLKWKEKLKKGKRGTIDDVNPTTRSNGHNHLQDSSRMTDCSARFKLGNELHMLHIQARRMQSTKIVGRYMLSRKDKDQVQDKILEGIADNVMQY